MRFRARSVRQLIASAVAVTAVSAFAPFVQAEEARPTSAQVEQLQKQLADMQKHMEEMQTALREAEAKGTNTSGMHQHMMGMQKDWQGMYDQCCMMNPAGCPAMGSPAKP